MAMHQGQPPAWPPAVAVPSLAAACFAIEAAPPAGLTLLAPPWLLAGPGAGFFAALVEAVRPLRPALPRAVLFVPGDAPGIALSAILAARNLSEPSGVMLDCNLTSFAALRAAAEESGVTYVSAPPPVFDLSSANPLSEGKKRVFERWFGARMP
ncbi:hypothetical protein IAI18_05860 [Acetobacteraceae bacterium H6797]|nr:hypothetical protein [Acetobacteraceae bacterium H6797]